MKIICGIYIIISPSGKVYIGESKDIYYRWSKYLKLLDCKNQTRLYNSFIFYGVENHIFQVVQECSFEDLKKYERYWQDYYDVIGKKGLNCRLTKTIEKKEVFSEETKQKIREKAIGRKCSEENKLKMSKRLKGNNWNLGKKLSEKHKKRISEGGRGRKHSKEHLEKFKLSRTGKSTKLKGTKFTKEHSEKISKSLKGKKKSKEHIKKITLKLIKFSVLQYDLEDNFIKEYESGAEAARQINYFPQPIRDCCNKKKGCYSAKGFKWKYKEKL